VRDSDTTTRHAGAASRDRPCPDGTEKRLLLRKTQAGELRANNDMGISSSKQRGIMCGEKTHRPGIATFTLIESKLNFRISSHTSM
jgi:hypothetical protein